jgi:hypothetical protein
MFKLFTKPHKRIIIEEDNISIHNNRDNIGKPIELDTVFKLRQLTPEIKVYENNQLTRLYRIDTLFTNSDLSGQFFHSTIRILENSAVMIDGIISTSKTSFPKLTDDDYEAVRFQPFFLSNANEKNIQLIGKGLFERGLHFTGTVTPTTVRCVCICDNCNQSFCLQHFHAGFSELQYFYSSHSKQTLIVPYSAIIGMPTQLQEESDFSMIVEIEKKLPRSDDGHFRYYNSFRCPHCLAPFIDFEKNRGMRPKEYYGNTLLNHQPKQWTDSNAS